jgi:hypothetical protein
MASLQVGDAMTEAEHRPYRTRTSVLFAAGAPKAVILRRGPRTHHHLVSWDLRDDTFTHGQWMKGNVRLCDLSPGGDKLIVFAEQYNPRAFARTAQGPYDPLKQARTRNVPAARPGRKTPRYLRSEAGVQGGRHPPRELKGSWTAISTPPYFSALALWPSIGRWTGGGAFQGERDIVLWEPENGITPIANVAVPATVHVRSFLQGRGSGRLSAYAPATTESERHKEIAAALLASGLPWVDWINLREGSDLLFAGDGRIFRLRQWERVAASAYLSAADQLVDLRDMTFQLMRAPDEAMRW